MAFNNILSAKDSKKKPLNYRIRWSGFFATDCRLIRELKHKLSKLNDYSIRDDFIVHNSLAFYTFLLIHESHGSESDLARYVSSSAILIKQYLSLFPVNSVFCILRSRNKRLADRPDDEKDTFHVIVAEISLDLVSRVPIIRIYDPFIKSLVKVRPIISDLAKELSLRINSINFICGQQTEHDFDCMLRCVTFISNKFDGIQNNFNEHKEYSLTSKTYTYD